VLDGGGMGISDLASASKQTLARWAAASRARVHVEDGRTWVRPILRQNEVRELSLSGDDRLLSDNDSLVRLDTGKRARFRPWTKSFTAMSNEVFDAELRIVVGPHSDRAVVMSIARMGAGPEIGDARLVDTTTMVPIADLPTSCQPHDVVWSPRGAWVVRKGCDHGVLLSGAVATDTATGRTTRQLASLKVSFSADDRVVASGSDVLDLSSGSTLFSLPE
jgi:hypothetical protein